MAGGGVWVGAVAVGLALSGCGAVRVVRPGGETTVMTLEEFAAHVEAVFRYHNGVVNELIVASSLADDGQDEPDSRIVAAEEQMAIACQPLNEAVTAMVEGRQPGFWTKLRLLDAVSLCEASTRRVEEIIKTAF